MTRLPFDMTPLELARSLMEATYDYATTDIAVPTDAATFLLEWNELNIPEDVLFKDEDGGKGREDEPHITVKYGLLASDVPPELREIVKATPPFPVFMGNVSLFTTNPKFDVVKIDVESPWLRALNQKISDAIPHEDTHPTYNPHLTLAYVEKGTCDHMEGDDPFKAKGVSREFVAAGLRFAGSGDSEDAGRKVEMLLFSKSKHPGELEEAVVGATPAEIKAIVGIIADAARESGGDVAIFTAIVNQGLAPYAIQFGKHEGEQHGSRAVATETGTRLSVPTPWDLRDPGWPQSLYAVLHHELVHDRQMARMADPKAVSDKATAWMTPQGRVSSERYLQQKQEVMAWAASMVDEWRRRGLTSDQMMRRLRSGQWGFGMKYWANREKFPQTFNRYVKQATEYIEQLREAKFAEAVTDVDPFANCSFPVDPDRIKQFLRSNGKRSAERPIL